MDLGDQNEEAKTICPLTGKLEEGLKLSRVKLGYKLIVSPVNSDNVLELLVKMTVCKETTYVLIWIRKEDLILTGE